MCHTAALYHFDSTLADSSKNRNHGQFIGAPSWRFENGENRMGTSSLYLDGKDDLVKINHRYCLDLPSFTADFWLKLQKNYTSPEPHYIISYGEDTEGFHFSLNNSSASSPNALLFGIGSENTSMEIGGPSLEHDRWYRITGSYDGGNISLYVDNELENSSNTGEIVYGDGPMIIGGHLSGDSYGSRTEMIIDEFRITDDLHGLLRQLQGGKEDGFNWIKRVGKWIAEQGIVFVNPYGNPFSEAGISGMGLVGNSISLGDEGLSTLLKVRSHDGALPHSTGSTKTTITPEAKDIASGSPHLNAVFPKMMNGTARRRLSPDMASFSIPLYRETGTDAITNALMFYGKGAIMFNGLDLLNASVTAGVAFWYMVNNVRPLYFIDCEDAPKHDVTTPIIEDTMAALERMGNDTEVSFHKKIIGNTGDLERLVGSNLKEVMVINTHGEVLPIPISYTDRGSSDDENTAALYDFEDGGGNVIRDASGNHHEGAMRNAQWTTDSHFGKYAMEFSGDPAERIRISRARELAPDTFTLECSVYLKRDYVSGTDTPVAILSNEEQVGNGSGARTFGYGLTINRPTVDEGFPANLTNRVVFSVGTYGGARESIYPDTPLETGRWHRIAATYDGSQMRLYVNNEQAAAREVKFLFPASLNNLEIGRRRSGDREAILTP